MTPFDLHVLSTPPAFILSQDRTLELKFFRRKNFTIRKTNVFMEHFVFLIAPVFSKFFFQRKNFQRNNKVVSFTRFFS